MDSSSTQAISLGLSGADWRLDVSVSALEKAAGDLQTPSVRVGAGKELPMGKPGSRREGQELGCLDLAIPSNRICAGWPGLRGAVIVKCCAAPTCTTLAHNTDLLLCVSLTDRPISAAVHPAQKPLSALEWFELRNIADAGADNGQKRRSDSTIPHRLSVPFSVTTATLCASRGWRPRTKTKKRLSRLTRARDRLA